MELTTAELKALFHSGKFFSVGFRKRSDGSFRRLYGRKAPRGKKTPAYNPNHHGLVWVYDIQNKGIRSIPLESIEWIKAGGKEFYPGYE